MSDLDQNSKVGTATDELSQRRRALLKGSAGVVPAILTLRSGSALAATSISCVTKVQSATPPATPPATVEDPAVDTWLRQSTDCRQLTNTVSSGDVVTVFKDPDEPKWYKIDTTNADEKVAFVDGVSGQMKSNNGIEPFQTYAFSETKTCYVLVQVGPNGSQPDSKVYGASTSAVLNSESCATSLLNQP